MSRWLTGVYSMAMMRYMSPKIGKDVKHRTHPIVEWLVITFFKNVQGCNGMSSFSYRKIIIIRSAAEGDERIYQGGPDGINWGTLSKEAQAANLRYSIYSWRYLHNVWLVFIFFYTCKLCNEREQNYQVKNWYVFNLDMNSVKWSKKMYSIAWFTIEIKTS
jgi:hypothetical protein